MTNPYRAMCSHPLAQKAYVAFVQICKGGSDDAGTYDADEAIVRRALKRLDELEGTLLAEPEAEGPSDEELLDLADDLDLDRFEGERYDYSGTVIKEGCWELDFARAALARWGRPTPQPVAEGPTDEEIHDFIALWWEDFGKGYLPCSSDEPLVKAALARFGGRPTPQPVAVSEHPWERDGWCDEQGRCWWTANKLGPLPPSWWMVSIPQSCTDGIMLPANALPTPEATND